MDFIVMKNQMLLFVHWADTCRNTPEALKNQLQSFIDLIYTTTPPKDLMQLQTLVSYKLGKSSDQHFT